MLINKVDSVTSVEKKYFNIIFIRMEAFSVEIYISLVHFSVLLKRPREMTLLLVKILVFDVHAIFKAYNYPVEKYIANLINYQPAIHLARNGTLDFLAQQTKTKQVGAD